ncbi:MAG: (Fe-S)-binding protein [archaeon]|nr:(Fe-S)-binding protein [archaeon]
MLLYFKGCTAYEKLTSIAESTRKLLDLFNVDYIELDEESCCGSVLLRTGFKNDGICQMKNTLDNLNNILNNNSIDCILTSCAGCYKTLKYDYKKILGVELKVIHISQLLDNLLNSNNIPIKKESDITVTYHDPCHLGRHSGEFEAPRNVISKLSNLIEMRNTKEQSRCCGSGGGVKSAYGDLANSIAKIRVDEAEETGANLLISSCPFCKLNLGQNSDNLEVMDLSEFVLKIITSDSFLNNNPDFLNEISNNNLKEITNE